MTITPRNLIGHELVGLKAHVCDSRDPTLICRSGKIIGESKEMITLDTDTGNVLLPKSVCVFDITLPDRTVVRVDGEYLQGRPEDRLKKRLSRRW
ncbi:MAG: Ribonuclease P protein component 1 [Candidatus Thorarchaeota archaeon]|nr:MAG: Ribonuclease P protein component 1 [Candidatus Thorarchaeota archaeon]